MTAEKAAANKAAGVEGPASLPITPSREPSAVSLPGIGRGPSRCSGGRRRRRGYGVRVRRRPRRLGGRSAIPPPPPGRAAGRVDRRAAGGVSGQRGLVDDHPVADGGDGAQLRGLDGARAGGGAAGRGRRGARVGQTSTSRRGATRLGRTFSRDAAVLRRVPVSRALRAFV